MALIILIAKVFGILCMLVLICFQLMVLGIIPGEQFMKFLRQNEMAQAIFAIIVAVGFICSFIAIS